MRGPDHDQLLKDDQPEAEVDGAGVGVADENQSATGPQAAQREVERRRACCLDDGVRTGSLWYLYLRTVESLPDDAAQVKAAALGLRDATGDEKTNFWLAIQDYLAKR